MTTECHLKKEKDELFDAKGEERWQDIGNSEQSEENSDFLMEGLNLSKWQWEHSTGSMKVVQTKTLRCWGTLNI